jgi:uncharacterized membrane protein
MRERLKIPTIGRKSAVALVVVVTVVSVAATAFGSGSHSSKPTAHGTSLPPIDIESLGSLPNLPTDPVQRSITLRKMIYAYVASDRITQAQAVRAIREIRRTGTLGRSSHPVPLAVRSLDTLPPQSHVPPGVAAFVAYVGRLTGSASADPKSVRLLRSDLGSSHTDVYGVRSASGSPCFFATGHGGTCAGSSQVLKTGVAWIVGAADADAPGFFVGLAADDVVKVELTTNAGIEVPVSLARNAAFAELPRSAWTAVVTTTRADARTASEEIPLR